MRYMISAVAALFLVVITGQSGALAQSSEIYTVPKVPVRADGASTQAAKEEARDLGRRQAMDILLRRLTAEEDWVYLPRLAIKQQASAYTGAQPDSIEDSSWAGAVRRPKTAVYIDPVDLQSFEEGFAVFDEKSSRSTYAATITYRFKPEKIRALLNDARLPYSEAQTRMALIIPVLETKSGKYLWETNNPWARAWLSRPLINELTPMMLPRGDVEDVKSITPAQALSFRQSELQALAEKYNVGQVIIAHGRLTEDGGQTRLRVRLLDGFLGSARRGAARVDTESADGLYDSRGGFGTAGSGNVRAATGGVLAEGWYRGEPGDFPLLARRAVESIVARYAKDWKSRTIVDHSLSTTYKVNAWFDSLAEWTMIKSSLEASPLVSDTKVGALTQTAATVEAVVLGDVKQLVLAMRERGLVLWTVDDIVWNIASPETYSVVRDRIIPQVPEVEEEEPRRRGFFRRRANGEVELEQGTDPGFPEQPRIEDGTARGTFLDQSTSPIGEDAAAPRSGPQQLEFETAPSAGDDSVLDGLEESLQQEGN